MKKTSFFLISISLILGLIRLSKTRTNLPSLSSRECEILELITLGYKDSEIPKLLRISARCRERYLRNILRKLNMHDISSAIGCALSKGLVQITYA